MNIHDATEQAYKNGFVNGVLKLSEVLKNKFKNNLYTKTASGNINDAIDESTKELLDTCIK